MGSDFKFSKIEPTCENGENRDRPIDIQVNFLLVLLKQKQIWFSEYYEQSVRYFDDSKTIKSIASGVVKFPYFSYTLATGWATAEPVVVNSSDFFPVNQWIQQSF